MRFVLAGFLAFLVSSTAFAASLLCDGVGRYEISSNVPMGSWHNITIKKNGVILLDNLQDNIDFIVPDVVSGDYMNVYRGVSIRRGIVSFIVLTIRLNPDGGHTGSGDAVIFDGRTTTEVKGLYCKMGS